jgi:hypothetical protein
MAYAVPILVQEIPILPTMCAIIVVVMYLENRSEKLGIISKQTQNTSIIREHNKENEEQKTIRRAA